MPYCFTKLPETVDVPGCRVIGAQLSGLNHSLVPWPMRAKEVLSSISHSNGPRHIPLIHRTLSYTVRQVIDQLAVTGAGRRQDLLPIAADEDGSASVVVSTRVLACVSEEQVRIRIVQGAAYRQPSVLEGILAVLARHLCCRLCRAKGGEGEKDSEAGELHLV